MFHAPLPSTAHAVLALSLIAIGPHTEEVLFGIGGATLLLLFAGIHDAWDGVGYYAFAACKTPTRSRHKSPASERETPTQCIKDKGVVGKQ